MLSAGSCDVLRLSVIAALLLLLGGCAPQWTKDDMSTLQRDDYECRRENTTTGAYTTHTTYGKSTTYTPSGTYTRPTSSSTATSPVPQLNYGMYYRCMQARGYRAAD